MKPAGIMLAIGTPKDKPKDDESAERTYAREMYSALKDGDEDGFIEAVLALKSCKGGMMDDEEEETETEG